MIRWAALGALVSGATACALTSGTKVTPSEESASQTSADLAPDASSTSTTSTSDSAQLASTCAKAAGASRAEQACWRWRCDGDESVATWNGDVATCKAGDLDADAATRALQRINVHRFLADVSAFTEELAWSADAQQCALIADANGKLSHTPPSSWSCWSQAGAATSAGSLVANRSVAASIAAYFQDPGNTATMVHRRWLLDETLSSVGFGSTDTYSCVVVDGTAVGAKRSPAPSSVRGWAAWPPGGPVPMDVFTNEQLDTAGWTVQSTSSILDPTDLEVTVTMNGTSLPITLTHLTALEGSRSAIRFVPVGWTTQAGATYVVHVNSVTAIDYAVQAIDCDADVP